MASNNSNMFRVPGTPSFYMSQLPVLYSGSNNSEDVGEVSLSTYINNGAVNSNGGLSFSSLVTQQSPPDVWHVNLDDIHAWHMSNATTIATSNIPSYFTHPYDGYTIGGKQCFVSLGGGLFSSNFNDTTGPFTQAGGEVMAIQTQYTFNMFTSPIAYGDVRTSNYADGEAFNSMGYMVTRQGAWPHTFLTYTQVPEIFQIGSFFVPATNGTATLSNSQTYDESQTQLTYSTSNGRFGDMYITTSYGGTISSNNLLTSNHPSMIEVYYTICSSNWPRGGDAPSGTQVFSDYRRQADQPYASNDGNYNFGSAMAFAGSYCMVGRSLLSTSNGQVAPDMADVRRFVASYVSQMPINISTTSDPNSNITTDLSAFFEPL